MRHKDKADNGTYIPSWAKEQEEPGASDRWLPEQEEGKVFGNFMFVLPYR